MKYGYEHGFEAGSRNDAHANAVTAATPGGKEWINRFLAKDPRQSAYIELLP